MQPLDVSVFAPMKRRWREVLSAWKDKCDREGRNFAALPKQQFPALLRELMDKDYSEAIKSGFECCGLHPLSQERALAKLPAENRDVVSNVQKQLIQQLSSMRYQQVSTTHANRPKKKEKLPAGAAYTCVGDREGTVCMAVDPDEELEEMQRQSAEESGESDREENVRSVQVQNIIERLSAKYNLKKRMREDDEEGEDKDDEDNDDSSSSSSSEEDVREEGDSEEEDADWYLREVEIHEKLDNPRTVDNSGTVDSPRTAGNQRTAGNPRTAATQEMVYLPGSYVTAVYQGEWYVGQVLDKKMEKNALPTDDYVYLNFMQRVVKDTDLFKWPDKADKLNTLTEDVLFVCSAPLPSPATSSSRSITYVLSKDDTKKANIMLNKAYYHTIFNVFVWLANLNCKFSDYFHTCCRHQYRMVPVP
jgi:hypothetical protein